LPRAATNVKASTTQKSLHQPASTPHSVHYFHL
jgi:hypothetical protein